MLCKPSIKAHVLLLRNINEVHPNLLRRRRKNKNKKIEIEKLTYSEIQPHYFFVKKD